MTVGLSFWATVTSTVHPMLPDRCPVCLSVTLVYCGQTVGWIRMLLGTEVGLDPGDIVLDDDPAPPTEKGTSAPTFRTTLLWHGRPSQQLLSSCWLWLIRRNEDLTHLAINIQQTIKW